MKQLLTFIAGVIVVLVVSDNVAAKVYSITPLMLINNIAEEFPFRDIGGEAMSKYSVTGYIETDGSFGLLDTSNIVDYEFTIAGRYPFVLTPETPSTNLRMENIRASETTLEIPFIYEQFDGMFAVSGSWGFGDAFAPHNCNDCYLTFGYLNRYLPPTTIAPPRDDPQIHYYIDDEGTGIVVDAVASIDARGGGTFPQGFVFATIPEPSSAPFLVFAMISFAATRKNRCV